MRNQRAAQFWIIILSVTMIALVVVFFRKTPDSRDARLQESGKQDIVLRRSSAPPVRPDHEAMLLTNPPPTQPVAQPPGDVPSAGEPDHGRDRLSINAESSSGSGSPVQHPSEQISSNDGGAQPTRPVPTNTDPVMDVLPPPSSENRIFKKIPPVEPNQSGQDDRPKVTRVRSPSRYHRVVDGDSLESIAAEYLGSADRAPDIFVANRGVLDRPDVLPLGVKLVLPAPPVRRVAPTKAPQQQVTVGEPREVPNVKQLHPLASSPTPIPESTDSQPKFKPIPKAP